MVKDRRLVREGGWVLQAKALDPKRQRRTRKTVGDETQMELMMKTHRLSIAPYSTKPKEHTRKTVNRVQQLRREE